MVDDQQEGLKHMQDKVAELKEALATKEDLLAVS